MPKSEKAPIESNERIIRLFWYTNFKNGEPKSSGFKPKKDEHEGISLFREECLTEPLECLKAILDEGKRDYYGVISYPHSAFTSRQMSFVLDHIEEVPGHVLLTSINPSSWNEDKNNFRYRVDELTSDDSRRIIRMPIKTDYKPV